MFFFMMFFLRRSLFVLRDGFKFFCSWWGLLFLLSKSRSKCPHIHLHCTSIVHKVTVGLCKHSPSLRMNRSDEYGRYIQAFTSDFA